MKAIGSIYLAWRKGKGSRRKIVGVIKKNASEGIRFEYNQEGVKEAEKEGFAPYVDFPDIKKTYTHNILDIFGQRLIKTERSDSQKYLDFWDIDKKYQDDKFYMLAYTQGMLSTDNFEFLADFYPVSGLCFVSEICGLSHAHIDPTAIMTDDILTYKLDKENSKDKYAVKVFKGNIELGYVKIIHSRVFHKSNRQLKIKIKSIDQNGTINRIFIEISV